MRISVDTKLEELGVNVETLSSATIENFQKSIGHVAKAAHGEWIRLAQNRLKSSRQIYINGLRQSESFNTIVRGVTSVFEIQLVGRMPNNFEFGMDSFDMKAVKPGWLGGKRAKTSADGKKYVIIPFRHSLSSAATLSYTGKAKRENLKQELKKVVKTYGLDRMVRSGTGQVIEGKVKKVPTRPDPRKGEVHRYLKGLTRYQKATRGTTASGQQRGSGTLMTFRVMSENSPSESWQHPGLTPVNLMREVEFWIDKELNKVIQLLKEEV